MRPRNLIESFNVAIEGLLYALRTQVNLKIHFALAFLVAFLCILFPISPVEKLMLVVAVSTVIVAELMNTAIEKTIDLITEDFHPLAKIAKNVAAGAVLVSAVAAAVIGYIIFVDEISNFIHKPFFRITANPPTITLAVLLLVAVLVIAGKSYNKKRGTFLKGGMPSGHSALSFALGTAVVILSGKNARPLVTLLVLLLCLLVAESRVESGTHTVLEVLAGALLGILSTLLIYQVFFL
ncbi:MAG: diacylglycerol kinase [Bacillota bacterium]